MVGYTLRMKKKGMSSDDKTPPAKKAATLRVIQARRATFEDAHNRDGL